MLALTVCVFPRLAVGALGFSQLQKLCPIGFYFGYRQHVGNNDIAFFVELLLLRC